jgi:hypothetical protein
MQNSAVLGGKLMAEKTHLAINAASNKTRHALALAIEACHAARSAMRQLEAGHAGGAVLTREVKAHLASSSALAGNSATLSFQIATELQQRGGIEMTGEGAISPLSELSKARVQFEVAQRKVRELAAQVLAEESRVLAVKLIAAREEAWRLEDELRGLTALQLQGQPALLLDQFVIDVAAQDQRPKGIILRNAHAQQARAWQDHYERLCWDEQAQFES